MSVRQRTTRMRRGAALIAAMLLLPACAGLPTAGDVAVGLELGDIPQDVDFLPVASGPISGSDPQQIVEGFLEAGITTSDNWETAREFLSPSMRRSWRPSAGVSIDAGAESRTVTSSVADDAVEDADAADVDVVLDLVASVDDSGAYAEAPGPSPVPFSLERMDDGEWRITEAPDGIVIDDLRFGTVFAGYALQYFDAGWSRLVPDLRWFPRRSSPATTVTRALVSGSPSAWLDPAVQTSFPAGVQLAQDAVPILDEVAEVALSSAAEGLDQVTLARMRTQLQATLQMAGVSVTRVRFTVDGRELDAGTTTVVDDPVDPGTLILKDGAFGRALGDEISPIPGISEEVVSITEPLSSIEVSADDTSAAVRLGSGLVYLLRNGSRDELDSRPGLIEPSLDPFGYTWTVPTGDPKAVQVRSGDVVVHSVANAWPNASSISDLRVAADGARVAAVITVGGQRWVVVAAIIRDSDGVPLEVGEVKQLTSLAGPSTGLVWLGTDRLGVLSDSQLVTPLVAGPVAAQAAPDDAVSIAGARTPSAVRVLDAEGRLFAQAGSSWRELATGVSVLGTRAGE